jgi:hypothetical protein
MPDTFLVSYVAGGVTGRGRGQKHFIFLRGTALGRILTITVIILKESENQDFQCIYATCKINELTLKILEGTYLGRC